MPVELIVNATKMNYDEFGFFNQQLAGMLSSGIPLEGALRQLCVGMKHGKLRDELQKLESDLAQGTSLEKALAARDLPEFYVRMVLVGAKGNDLPAMLTLLADYYQRANSISARLKGLLVYPMIVLVAAFSVSVFLALIFGGFISQSGLTEIISSFGARTPPLVSFGLWTPPVLLALALIFAGWALTSQKMRRSWRWRLPGFKEANLSQLAGSLALMLKKGGSLNDSLAVLRGLEKDSPLSSELQQWETRVASGEQKFSEVAANSKILPPLFVWMVASSGEDWSSGFARAAELYQARAIHRIETLLYAVLPVSVLAVGIIILGQFMPLIQMFIWFMNSLVHVDSF